MFGNVLFGHAVAQPSTQQTSGQKPAQEPSSLKPASQEHLKLIAPKNGESLKQLAARARNEVDQVSLSSAGGKQIISVPANANGNLCTDRYQKQASGLGKLLPQARKPLNIKDIQPGTILLDQTTGKKIKVTAASKPQPAVHVSGIYNKVPGAGVQLHPTRSESGLLFQFSAMPAH